MEVKSFSYVRSTVLCKVFAWPALTSQSISGLEFLSFSASVGYHIADLSLFVLGVEITCIFSCIFLLMNQVLSDSVMSPEMFVLGVSTSALLSLSR